MAIPAPDSRDATTDSFRQASGAAPTRGESQTNGANERQQAAITNWQRLLRQGSHNDAVETWQTTTSNALRQCIGGVPRYRLAVVTRTRTPARVRG